MTSCEKSGERVFVGKYGRETPSDANLAHRPRVRRGGAGVVLALLMTTINNHSRPLKLRDAPRPAPLPPSGVITVAGLPWA